MRARKKPLPMLPSRIGLITSPSGAAVRDVVRILTRRFPNVHLTLYPVRVQGEGAAAEIVEALRYFQKKLTADVILLARGGGSIEDLWAFNEESRGARDCGLRDSRHLRHRTRNRFHHRRFCRRCARLHSFGRGRTRRADAPRIRQARCRSCEPRSKVACATASGLSRRVHELAGRRGFRRPLDLLRQQRQRADEMTSRVAQGLRARLRAFAQAIHCGAPAQFARLIFAARLRALQLAAGEAQPRPGRARGALVAHKARATRKIARCNCRSAAR